MKKALVIRIGALGDMIIITPILRLLKEDGYEVIVYTGKRGNTILKHDPNVSKIILYDKEGTHDPKIDEAWDKAIAEEKPDKVINFSESIEVSVTAHPKSAYYNYPKNELDPKFKQNFYDATAKWAGYDLKGLRPELYITSEEEAEAKKYLREGKFNIVWGWSGSGMNKAYPWAEYVMGEIFKKLPNAHVITIGDERCKILEYNSSHKNLTKLSGEIDFRTSIALVKQANLLVAPDTGILHAAGAYDTPKIGILGHTSIENITKYFKNDYSLEAIVEECECSPCYKLIYNSHVQCPIEKLSGASYCMHWGQPMERLFNQIKKVYDGV